MAEKDEQRAGLISPLEIEAASVPFANDGTDAPTIYADIIRGAAVFGETTKINLVEHKVSAQDGQVRAVVVATLVIPTSQLAPWGKFFTAMGAGPAPEPADGN